MLTVDKALSLLAYFTEGRPVIGLSDMSRLAGFNKATTRRLLVALEGHAFVEQDPVTKVYRLGPGLLRLARVREAVSPVDAVVQPVMEELVARLGETAHFSMYVDGSLATIGLAQSTKPNRVILERGAVIPLHATASGMAFMAFASPNIVDAALSKPLKAYTKHTIVGASEMREKLRTIADAGVAVDSSHYSDGVCCVAAPILRQNGFAEGAIAVALPTSRAVPDVVQSIQDEVKQAAIDISSGMGVDPKLLSVRVVGE